MKKKEKRGKKGCFEELRIPREIPIIELEGFNQAHPPDSKQDVFAQVEDRNGLRCK